MKYQQSSIFQNQIFIIENLMIPICRNIQKFCIQGTNTIKKFQSYSDIELKQLIRQPNPLRDQIFEQIERTGQIKIQKYWKLALTDPQHGYYVKKNVFSKDGDFTTAPQISSLFGQMIAVWIIYFLQKTLIVDKGTHSVNKRFRIIQLGAGRGLLMKDIINSFRDAKIVDNFDIEIVQVSEYNRKCQQESIMEAFKNNEHYFKFQFQSSTDKQQSFCSQNPDKSVSLRWHQSLQSIFYKDSQSEKNGQEIPFTIFVMNQFMDALPTTILQYTENGWRQKVLRRSAQDQLSFQLGISSHELSEKLVPQTTQQLTIGEQIQISPESLLTMDLIAKIINLRGGCAINIDYGDDGHFQNSIRAIKDHKYVPAPYFWEIPGSCDLSAYVNFSALAQFAEKNTGIKAYETIPQGYFLQAMGIVHRVDLLKQKADKATQERLDSEQQRLVDPKQMGEIYKVQIITKKQYGEIYPFIQVDENSF